MFEKATFLTLLRVVTFTASREELAALNKNHLALGLFITWLVGMGRWWDDPKANLIQHLGLGSVVYVFALSLFIWLIIKPMGCPGLKWGHLTTYISLTASPGFLYALPVEAFTDLQTANSINIWFLLIVATWRVLLYIRYLRCVLNLGLWKLFVSLLFPLLAIVAALVALNLHHVVFEIMGGIRESDRTAHDSVYIIMFMITALSSYMVFPFVGIAWLLTVGYQGYLHFQNKKR